MFIGVDFDNTIVRYDSLFHRACVEEGLIPASVPANKSAVRDYLRGIGKEEQWTTMQGVVYGSRMSEAEPMPGVLDFFRACRSAGVPVAIVSHKTRYPYIGDPHDFHAAAYGWLVEYGFFIASNIGLERQRVFFELSKAEKIARIRSIGCDVFIDDLPEIFSDPEFPMGVDRILFDPGIGASTDLPYKRVRSWDELSGLLTAARGG
jgi:hypothetical protein